MEPTPEIFKGHFCFLNVSNELYWDFSTLQCKLGSTISFDLSVLPRIRVTMSGNRLEEIGVRMAWSPMPKRNGVRVVLVGPYLRL